MAFSKKSLLSNVLLLLIKESNTRPAYGKTKVLRNELSSASVSNSSTTLSCDRKFRNFWFCGVALQRLSDLVCLENGLSVIEPVKPSQRVKRTEYPDRRSFREDIRDAIDA